MNGNIDIVELVMEAARTFGILAIVLFAWRGGSVIAEMRVQLSSTIRQQEKMLAVLDSHGGRLSTIEGELRRIHAPPRADSK
jgi:hypothetical protein